MRVTELNNAHFGFELGNVKVKDQSTRWGSYSKRTNCIYLNFRLLSAPPEVLDYVIVHELAHVKRAKPLEGLLEACRGRGPELQGAQEVA